MIESEESITQSHWPMTDDFVKNIENKRYHNYNYYVNELKFIFNNEIKEWTWFKLDEICKMFDLNFVDRNEEITFEEFRIPKFLEFIIIYRVFHSSFWSKILFLNLYALRCIYYLINFGLYELLPFDTSLDYTIYSITPNGLDIWVSETVRQWDS